jgi:hypothetical protein
MPKIDLDLDKTKDITIGEIQKLPTKEQVEIFKPMVEANSKRIAEVFNDVSNLSETIRSIGNIKPQITNFLENIRIPELPSPEIMSPVLIEFPLTKYNPPVRISKSKSQIIREKREAYMNELNIQFLEEQLHIAKGIKTPQYDINTGVITFMGKDIQIPLDSNIELVCRVVLKNLDSMSKRWSWDEIVERNRESKDNFTSTQIYTAARAITEKVAHETTVKDFLITKPINTVRLNPKFVPK